MKTRAPVTTPHSHEVTSTDREVSAFLAKAQAVPLRTDGGRGRLVFAMDATMSRQPTWDRALAIQGQMFEETARIGGLDVQLVYFRGFNECMASRWVSDPQALAKLMAGIACRGGYTQIRKVLQHIKTETERAKVHAAVYVGDCMEEDVDLLCARAGEIGLLGVPMFMFQEGHEPRAEAAFREIARLTKGAYCRFDLNAAGQLRALLSAVAVYAAGGRQALADYGRGNRTATLLLEQLG
nr:VWA domain-containing protein [Rhodoligotrophos defluvii]